MSNFEPAWVEDFLLRVLPSTWRLVKTLNDGCAYRNDGMGLTVIVSGATEQDGKRWLHVSLSRRERLPSWEDLRIVKNLFVGQERLALQVLPPQSKYVNIHPYVLHLWHCVDGDPTPDFTHGGASI